MYVFVLLLLLFIVAILLILYYSSQNYPPQPYYIGRDTNILSQYGVKVNDNVGQTLKKPGMSETFVTADTSSVSATPTATSNDSKSLQASNNPVVSSISDLYQPVGTLLTHEAPPEVQKELNDYHADRPEIVVDQLPQYFDSRQKWSNSIGQPFYQGQCAGCWAFASAGAVSDRLRIAEPTNTDLRQIIMYHPFVLGIEPYPIMNSLSPYQLTTCDICGATIDTHPNTVAYLTNVNGHCEHGCRGGYVSHVYRYLVENGCQTLKCAPPICNPLETQCQCIESKDPSCPIYKATDSYPVGLAEHTDQQKIQFIMEDVYTKGPVTAGFKLYESFYSFFDQNPKGVYTAADRMQSDQRVGGHSVEIVGWGFDPEKQVNYWLMKNSWGLTWGDGGYFKMQNNIDDVLMDVWAACVGQDCLPQSAV